MFMILSLTGHRPDKLGNDYDYKGPYSRAIYNALVLLLRDIKPTKVISGMALGADTIWANAAINEGIPFIAAIPFEGQERKWFEQSKRLYKTLLKAASEIVVVCPGGYAAWKMQKRNEWMVDHSDMLIAVWNGTPGGTANCKDYAESKNKHVITIDPELLIEV